MKTLLGTEVDLGPGHIVLDGVPAPAKGAQQPPLFGHVYCGVATVRGRPSQLLLSAEPLCKRPAATQSAQIRELSSNRCATALIISNDTVSNISLFTLSLQSFLRVILKVFTGGL